MRSRLFLKFMQYWWFYWGNTNEIKDHRTKSFLKNKISLACGTRIHFLFEKKPIDRKIDLCGIKKDLLCKNFPSDVCRITPIEHVWGFTKRRRGTLSKRHLKRIKMKKPRVLLFAMFNKIHFQIWHFRVKRRR